MSNRDYSLGVTYATLKKSSKSPRFFRETRQTQKDSTPKAEFVITIHALNRAITRTNQNETYLRNYLRQAAEQAKDTGFRRDGLEAWSFGRTILLVRAEGLVRSIPVRVTLISVLSQSQLNNPRYTWYKVSPFSRGSMLTAIR